jgi:drug/metabolite transporter (DMT)-like permease
MIIKLIVALILPIINLSAQMLVKYLLAQNKNNPIKELSGIEFALQMLSIPGIWLVAALQFCGFVLWGFVISRMELGVANALAGSLYYTLSALAAMLVFGEVLSLREWGGLALISAGVMVLLSKASF